MFKLIFTSSRGESIELYDAPYRLMRVEGLGDVEAINQTQRAPYQDGVTLVDTILEEKQISIELKITGEDEIDLAKNRRKLASVFNPKLGEGLLKRVSIDGTHQISAVAEAIPYLPDGSTNRGLTFQKALIELKAPNPYWRDPQEVSRALRAYQGRFVLPTTFPFELGVSGDTTTLVNEGDVEAPVTIDIQGPVTNPQVINKTTGQFIKLNRSLSANEVLHIDTNDQNKRVEIYRNGTTIEKAIGYLDHYSEFWKLEVGNNEIQYIADAGDGNAIVAVAWHNHYAGI